VFGYPHPSTRGRPPIDARPTWRCAALPRDVVPARLAHVAVLDEAQSVGFECSLGRPGPAVSPAAGRLPHESVGGRGRIQRSDAQSTGCCRVPAASRRFLRSVGRRTRSGGGHERTDSARAGAHSSAHGCARASSTLHHPRGNPCASDSKKATMLELEVRCPNHSVGVLFGYRYAHA